MDLRILLVVAVVALVETEAWLPSYITTCSPSDPKFDECTLRSARASMKQFSYGDPQRGIPSLEPLYIKEIRAIGRKGDGLSVVLTDAKLHGCGDLDLKKFKIDLAKQRVSAKASGNLVIDATYDIKGRILIIPLDGNGHALVHLNATRFSYYFDYEMVKNKDGKIVASIVKDNLKYDIGRASFNLENLFGGDRILGESTNRLLNDSWKDIINDVGPPVAKILQEGFSKSIKKFLSLVTYDDLFPK